MSRRYTITTLSPQMGYCDAEVRTLTIRTEDEECGVDRAYLAVEHHSPTAPTTRDESTVTRQTAANVLSTWRAWARTSPDTDLEVEHL